MPMMGRGMPPPGMPGGPPVPPPGMRGSITTLLVHVTV